MSWMLPAATLLALFASPFVALRMRPLKSVLLAAAEEAQVLLARTNHSWASGLERGVRMPQGSAWTSLRYAGRAAATLEFGRRPRAPEISRPAATTLPRSTPVATPMPSSM